jgi:hypothetical protein
MLLSLFVLVFINFFYTSVLSQSHLTPEQIIANALKLVISTVTEPLGVAIFFGLFLLYSLKTWQFVATRLRGPDVHFLFYSINALSTLRQLRAWSVVQFVVSLPLVVLGGYAMLVGVVFRHWLVPLLIPAYLLALIWYSARRYVRLTNRLVAKPARPVQLPWLRKWPKPLFSLFLFEVLLKKRVTYAITKLASMAIIALIFGVFPDSHSDLRLIGLLSLCLALTHSILVFQSSEFELFYMRFARNFPYRRWQVYGQQAALYGLLLLPELAWLFVAAPIRKAFVGAGLLLGVTLLYRAMLYRPGQRMKPYLRVVFGVFVIFLLADLFGLTALLAAGSALAAWVMLYRHHYVD